MSVVHWDDEPDDLAAALGADWACLRRVRISTGDPLHLDADDRETIVWTLDRDVALVRAPGDVERSLRAEGSVDLLVFAAGAPRADPEAPAREGGVVTPSRVQPERVLDGRTAVVRRDVGAALGTASVGVEHVTVDAGRRSYPALDLDELTVVLGGSGEVELPGGVVGVQRGVVATQAARFTAGLDGLELLVFSERPPG